MPLPEKPNPLPGELDTVCRKIIHLAAGVGGRAFLVGGCVRDAFLGVPIVDADIEVFGLSEHRLEKALSKEFSLDWVGRAFGVFKIQGFPVDVSLPRRESKIDAGHRGFAIEKAPDLSMREAASRRDFTINGLSWDLLNHEIIDPFGGRADLEKGILKHSGTKFCEDPLRVLRAMQLAARFEFPVAAETIELCRRITMQDLSAERIFEEWKKLILKGKKPSAGLNFLKQCGWIVYFPELNALDGCPQDPLWHPEGDVWTHTLHCLDAFAAERTGEDWEDLVVGLAVLCHDMGKPATTVTGDDGRIRSPGHDVEGEGIAIRFLSRLTRHKDLLEEVVPLVRAHMRPMELFKAKAGDSAVRRLARSVRRIDRLVRVVRADMRGRPPLPEPDAASLDWLMDRAEALTVKDAAPKPILMGRHLIDMGLPPGPRFKSLMESCYEAQLDGAYETAEQGKDFLKKLLSPN